MNNFRDEFYRFPLPNEPSEELIEALTRQLIELGLNYEANVDNIGFLNMESPEKINDKYYLEPPEKRLSTTEILEFIKDLLPNFPSVTSKHFVGYIPSSPRYESTILAGITPYFNQFTGTVQGSPGAVAIEGLMIKWITELLEFPKNSFGCFTSEGSMANLTAIYTGLAHQLRKKGIDFMKNGLIGSKRPIVYLSEETHFAIEKALLVLGLGQLSMRKLVPNDKNQITKSIVEAQIKLDLKDKNLIPIMVVATCGTTNTGSIDDLEGIHELCNKYNLWFHVDGTYGAFCKLAKLEVAKKASFINKVDSLALDCHKWFYAPYEAGLTLVKDHLILRDSFDIAGEYVKDTELVNDFVLQRNFRSYGIQLTREFRGLKVWGVFASLGVDGIRNAITRDIIKADYLRHLIEIHPDFNLIPGGELSIVCFRYNGEDGDNQFIIDYINHRNKFYFNSTKVNGRVVLRVCFLNLRSDLNTVDELFDLIKEAKDNL